MNSPVIGENEAKLADIVFNLVLLQRWRDLHCLGEPKLFEDEIQMLAVIDLNPGITNKGLVTYLDISYSTIAEKLEKLKRFSYIVQENDDGGKRKVPINLTEQGRQALLMAKYRYLHQVNFEPLVRDEKISLELSDLLTSIGKLLTIRVADPSQVVL